MPIVIPSSSGSNGSSGYTFLELAQRLRQECRVSGSGPSAVTGQVAEYQRLLDWTAQANREIESSNPFWRFKRASATCATTSGKTNYYASDFGITDFGRWALDYERGDTFRSYVTATGTSSEVALLPVDYDQWRDTYYFGALRTTYSRPMVIAVAPDNSLVLGPISDGSVTLTGDYYAKPTLLTNAGDYPAMPEEFQMAIVYKAMMFYGVSEAAPEIYDFGKMQYERLYADLTRHEAPRYRVAGALV